MIGLLRTAIRRFRKDERGSLHSIEFVLLMPLMFSIFMTSVEMGMIQYRQMFLDRGLDMAVRMVRLNTGTNYSHTQLKDMICDFSGLPSCAGRLKLEMNPVDVRTFNGFGGSADCTDASQPIAPNRSFVHGIQHQMMLLRACYKFDPVFPYAGLGLDLVAEGDGAGMSKMVSMSAFVQEP